MSTALARRGGTADLGGERPRHVRQEKETKMGMKMRALAAAALLAAGCASPRTEAGVPDPAPAANVGRVEREVVEAVNRYRQEHGLPLLRPNARIATIARRHSEAAARGEVALQDGESRVRARAVSVTMPVQNWAEDVVLGRLSDAEAAPRLADMLIAAGRAHIETATFEDIGIGIARDPSGHWFLTSILILSRGGYQRP
jgi:hypothetical protein